MNPVTFNQRFDIFAGSQLCFRSKKEMSAIASAPLLVWREDSNEGYTLLDFPEAFHGNGCPRLPFGKFRVDGFYCHLGDGFKKFRAWIKEDGSPDLNPGFTVVFDIEGDESGSARSQNLNIGLWIVKFTFHGIDPVRGMTFRAHPMMIDLRLLRIVERDMPPEMIWNVAGEWVQKLCIDFQNPHFYLAKKCPKRPNGKSVLWEKAREHYVLLHKGHPANNRILSGKQPISDGPMIDRMAHSRRAHYRLLKSPKFKHKQGQRIWIQSAWVGPKEWADTSGQIYKIVERNAVKTESAEPLSCSNQ